MATASAQAPGRRCVESLATGGGPGGGAHTAITGSELAEVTAAVTAEDSAVTVTQSNGTASTTAFRTV